MTQPRKDFIGADKISDDVVPDGDSWRNESTHVHACDDDKKETSAFNDETHKSEGYSFTQDSERVGITLGKYVTIRLLGIGGFSRVYLAKAENGCKVAIKVLTAESPLEKERIVGSAREAQRLAKLSHPNIVRFIETFTAKTGETCIVTEYASGGPLSVRMSDSGDESFQWDAIAAADLIAPWQMDLKPCTKLAAFTAILNLPTFSWITI